MAEGPRRSSTVDRERKSSRRRKNLVSEDVKKETVEPLFVEDEPMRCEESTLPECAVCLQTCVYPARLPCSHIFCFLCLKGIANQSHRCAMCRQDIPPDYLEHPDLVQMPLTSDKSKNKESEIEEESYQWFYEGRNGWWRYDEQTNETLEELYKRGETSPIDVLICGSLYIIDLSLLVQYHKDQPWKRRKIRRDVIDSVNIKGVAGIRKV